MGEYKKEWFAFKIESLRHILDLTIEPSFAKAVCFQFHQMQDNSYKVFWNFETVKIASLIIQYAKDNKIDMKTPVSEVWLSQEFAKFIKSHSPIYSADLSNDDMEIANRLWRWALRTFLPRKNLRRQNYRI